MTELDIKKAFELLEEKESLLKIDGMLKDRKHGSVAHFVFKQHYGICNSVVEIEPRHSKRLVIVLDEILREINKEIKGI